MNVLPADYDSLTNEGQRLARVAACRQWYSQSLSLPDRVAAFCGGIDFFDRYYLRPDDKANFNPLFYKASCLPTPYFYWWKARNWLTHRTTLSIGPRGSLKTTGFVKRIIFQNLSHPGYSFVYCTSTHPLMENVSMAVRTQLYTNSRIYDDWAKEPEFGGRIRPKKGDLGTGVQSFHLNNGSQFFGLSVTSRQRGIRPRRYILDDPEYDPNGLTPPEELAAGMERLIFSIIRPAITQPGCGADWEGTFVSKRHYAHRAMQGVLTSQESDSRFMRWARLFIKASKDGVSCWPEMWPSTTEERLRMEANDPTYRDHESLEELRTAMGPAVYLREMEGELSDSADSCFGTLSTEKHGYSRKGDIIVTGLTEEPLSVLLARSKRYLICDTSFTAKTTSDPKAFAMLALTPDNHLYVLNVFEKRCKQQEFIEAVLKEGSANNAMICPLIGSTEGAFLEALQHEAGTRMHGGRMPFVRAIKLSSRTRKVSAIESLRPRFEYGLIKLPLDKQFAPGWSSLFSQIAGFSPDSSDGGLSNDDLIECVASIIYATKHRPPSHIAPVDEPVTILDLLRKGETVDPDFGIPYIQMLGSQDLQTWLTERRDADRHDTLHTFA